MPEGSLELKVRNASVAGASAVLVAGGSGAATLDLDETAAAPVAALPTEAGREAADALRAGDPVSIRFGGVRRTANATAGLVAPFSSGGMAFGGSVKPDLVAPGVGIATADGGVNADGSERYATATGSSVSAAVVAASAALVAQARPGLTAAELKSLLVGNARQIVKDGVPEPVTVQGAGVVDVAAAAAAEVAVAPATLAFGRVDDGGWQVTQTVRIRNLSRRELEVGFGITRDRWGEPELSFAATPAHLVLRAGKSGDVTLAASGSGPLEGQAGGAFVVSPRASRIVRVPWAVSFRSGDTEPLLGGVALSNRAFSASDAAPAVLAFRAGRVTTDADGGGESVQPVQLLVAELWRAGGKRLGVLTRMHDLLPGRYAFGVTGRGPMGRQLRPGRYVIRLVAYPPAGDAGAKATSVDVRFRLRP